MTQIVEKFSIIETKKKKKNSDGELNFINGE